jgi:hypothetical protein
MGQSARNGSGGTLRCMLRKTLRECFIIAYVIGWHGGWLWPPSPQGVAAESPGLLNDL